MTTKWSNPAEALKAVVSGAVTFAGAAVVSLESNNSAPSLVQWLIAGVFGLGALVTTYYVPNADAKQKAVIADAEKAAVDVVEHKPAQAIVDATQAVMAANYLQRAAAQAALPVLVVAGPAPVTPAPAVDHSLDPLSPVQAPVSEPVGATAVSAAP